MKIRALIAQQHLFKAIEDPIVWPEGTTEEQKSKVLETATETFIFHLSDSKIRQVDRENTSAKIWKKLDELFQVKSWTNKIFLKEQLFGYKISSSKSLDENLDDFLTMTIELENSITNEALSNKNQAVIILNFLPETFKEVKNVIKYCRIEITLKEVVSVLQSKEFEMKSERGQSLGGEGHYVHGGSSTRSNGESSQGK